MIILGLTSNIGASDFQFLEIKNEGKLYQSVLKTCAAYGTLDNTMFVIGATKAEFLKEVRSIIPDHFLLVPGE